MKKVSLKKIGNDRGIILEKTILELVGADRENIEFQLSISGNEIHLKPLMPVDDTKDFKELKEQNEIYEVVNDNLYVEETQHWLNANTPFALVESLFKKNIENFFIVTSRFDNNIKECVNLSQVEELFFFYDEINHSLFITETPKKESCAKLFSLDKKVFYIEFLDNTRAMFLDGIETSTVGTQKLTCKSILTIADHVLTFNFSE